MDRGQLNAINKAFTFKQSLWEWLQTIGKPGRRKRSFRARRAQQPAAAHAEGEAGRRYREGIKAKIKRRRY